MRHYVMTINTRGPVHIGDGHTLGKKDYFVQRNGKMAILDAPRFVAQLDEGQLERYCSFLENDSRKGLQDFLSHEGSALERAAQRCVAYQANASLSRNRGGRFQYLEVHQFVKDVYGKPYIPGSSIKGVLRTALLATLTARDPDSDGYRAAVKDCKSIEGLQKLARDIERHLLWKKPRNAEGPEDVFDVMRFVSVADSDPLETSDLVFVKKYDKFSKRDDGHHKHNMGNLSDSEYYEGNALDVYRECLRPGVTAHVDIDVDERIDSYLGVTLDDKLLSLILKIQDQIYQNDFLSHFDLSGVEDGASSATTQGLADDGGCQHVYKTGLLAGTRCRNRAINNTGYCGIHQQDAKPGSDNVQTKKLLPCYLGGGVGFDSKTIVNAILLSDSRRVEKMAHILFDQFPSKFDRGHYANLSAKVNRAGFQPRNMSAVYKNGRLKKAKDDHRHWQDPKLDVSPHTLKLGIVDGKKYQMGLCGVTIQER